MTSEVADALGEAARLEARGAVRIKGKGELDTFWLVGLGQTV